MNKLLASFSNKPHVAYPLAGAALAEVICQIGEIWAPGHRDQFRQTVDTIQKGAIAWAAVGASNLGGNGDHPSVPTPPKP